METILSSLNALVEKLGGDTSDNKLIVDALNDISEKFGGDADNKMIVDALNNIVENYSGGGDYTTELQNVTFVNNSSVIVGFSYTQITNTGLIKSASSQLAYGRRTTIAMPSAYYSTGDYFGYLCIPVRSKNGKIKLSASTVYGTLNGSYDVTSSAGTWTWYNYVATDHMTKDITITFEDE